MDWKEEFDLKLSPPPYQPQPSSQRVFIRRRRGHLVTITAFAITLVILSYYNTTHQASRLSTHDQVFSKGLAKCHEINGHDNALRVSTQNRVNPRWNPTSGQKHAIRLRNATLFDGKSILAHAVDIVFEKGAIKHVYRSEEEVPSLNDVEIYDVHGRFVTPGLVDIHSHHLEIPFASVSKNQDVNEKPQLGPITPFIRAIDGFKPYDTATQAIASGGVTSSLILPGSGNIIGGQGYLVKNLPLAGENREPVVEELLFEHGLPEKQRQQYLKMACGENPKYLYGHTRLGNAWLLRQHLEKAQVVRAKQDEWCQSAQQLEAASLFKHSRVADFVADRNEFPTELELEVTVALLRGKLNVNIHCYEPEDLERMLAVLHEFGIHPQAFHHALEAWQVPEFLKQQEENITIATFAENALFKHEAYGANLRGPKILDDHGIRVVLKSDHTGESNNAKYLLSQAAVSHSFGLSEIKALQSVTSVAAQSIQQDHRIGFVQPGYDADLVIWDSHPLSVGATAVQVFVDGREVLDTQDALKKLEIPIRSTELVVPRSRPSIERKQKQNVCGKTVSAETQVVFTGIKHNFLDRPFAAADRRSDDNHDSFVMVITNGEITCFDLEPRCRSSQSQKDVFSINLSNGYVTPGLVAFGNNIGILDIPSEPSTGDGSPDRKDSSLNEQKNLHYAKNGVRFGGRSFGRARVGGVTKAVTAPISGGGVLQGVSVGLRTSENATVLRGGIWKGEVALHVTIGQEAKGDDTPTISSGIERLRQILKPNQRATEDGESAYVRAANGSLPVVVSTVNEDDISQVILLKRYFPSVNFVIFGGHAAPLVAKELNEAKIPVILTGNRGAPDRWEKKSAFVGPPLSPSPAQVLIDAGVLVALAVRGDSKVHGLAQEAQWAAKFAGLNEKEAIKLVSTNFDKILNLARDKLHFEDNKDQNIGNGYNGDFVVWEGNPLQGEGSVVLTVQDDGKVGDCWPDSEGTVL